MAPDEVQAGLCLIEEPRGVGVGDIIVWNLDFMVCTYNNFYSTT